MEENNETEQNEQDDAPEVEEAPQEKAPPPPMVHVHNVTRGRQNRTLRAKQPKHHGLKQYLGGGKYRSIRGRPIRLTEEEFQRVLPELQKKVEAGIFEVRTPDGRLLALSESRLVLAEDLPAAPPKPNPPLDSIANDQQNVGNPMPQFPGGDTAGTGDTPDLIAKLSSEGGEESETTPGESEGTDLDFDMGEEEPETNEGG